MQITHQYSHRNRNHSRNNKEDNPKSELDFKHHETDRRVVMTNDENHWNSKSKAGYY